TRSWFASRDYRQRPASVSLSGFLFCRFESEKMNLYYQVFKDFAAGVESIAVTVAVIVGGWWTLHTLHSLASAQRASAELTEIERRQQPAFGINIRTKTSAKPQDGSYHLFVTLGLRNDGRQNIALDLSEPPIHIAKLSLEPHKPPVMEGRP